MAGLICGRRLLPLANNLFKTPARNEGGYYVLLPEIGEDLPEKNPLLKEETGLPEFNHISLERCIAATGKQTVEFEQGIQAIENDIREFEKLNVFKDVLEPIEKLELPLQMTWGISKILYFGNQSRIPTNSYLSIHRRSWAAMSQKFNSRPIYEACRRGRAEDSKEMTDEHRRVLDKYILEARLNGVELEGKYKEYFGHLLRQIGKKGEEFRRKLDLGVKMYTRTIGDAGMMKGFPPEFLKSVALDPAQYDVGPWLIGLKPHVYQTFMEYCPDSSERLNLWLANVCKASGHSEHHLSNSPHVNGITSDRSELAKLLGFKHYSEMSMCTKMAGSLENVYKFMDTLRKEAFPKQVEEINDLNRFARERGFEGLLQQWDMAYWTRKQKRTLYNYDEEVLKEYFPLPKVLDGLYNLLAELFNVRIVERSSVGGGDKQQQQQIDVWHKDVRFYDVYDLDVSERSPVGSFYFDPYARDDEKVAFNRHSGFVLIVRNKSDVNDVKPLTSMIYNFEPPVDGMPSLLTFAGVQSLFENFGHMMQQVLTRVRSSEVAGLSNVEWDAFGTSKHLMTNLMYEPEVLRAISGHVRTGECLDDETIERIRQTRTHMAGYELCKELYLCKFDLELHSVNKIWEKIMKVCWKEHFVFPEHKKDSHVCSWAEIFIDNQGGAYFSDLWSKMLAADVYSAFLEDRENRRKIGKRYKDTFLALGGSVSASEVFRRFRGRDPSLQAFIKSLNLKVREEEDDDEEDGM